MSVEQEQISNNQKWVIPQGCGLDKLMTVLIALRNKNGDTEYVDDEKFKKSIDLSTNLISGNLTFLRSIKLLEKQDKTTKLTKIGSELTEAWVRDDENISKLFQQVIKESHLVDLLDYTKTNQGLKIAKIFTFIKSQARVPDAKDGRPFSDIPYQGAKTVIKLFEKADLLTDEQINELKEYKNTNPTGATLIKPKASSNKRKPVESIPSTMSNTSGTLSLPSGIQIPLTSSKNVEVALVQLNDLLQELKHQDDVEDTSSSNSSVSEEE